jgi:hypothetical protein
MVFRLLVNHAEELFILSMIPLSHTSYLTNNSQVFKTKNSRGTITTLETRSLEEVSRGKFLHVGASGFEQVTKLESLLLSINGACTDLPL